MYSQQILCLVTFLFIENYWSNAHNRRKFFIGFASQKGFDPLVPENWEHVDRMEVSKKVKRKKAHKERVAGRGKRGRDLKSNKGGNGPLYYHKYSLHNAITSSFPEFGVHISLLFFLFPVNNIFYLSIGPKKTSKYVQPIAITARLFNLCIHRQILE